MKPRWTECHPQVDKLVSKAKDLEERIEKAGWENPPAEGSTIGGANLEIETGGRIAQRPQYWTNQSTIEVEDIANKGAIETADPTEMMAVPPHDYGPTGSTLHDHEGGSDTTTDALTKSEDRVLGSLREGDDLRLRKVADAAEDLARRLL
jgi:hypothetical protein